MRCACMVSQALGEIATVADAPPTATAIVIATVADAVATGTA